MELIGNLIGISFLIALAAAAVALVRKIDRGLDRYAELRKTEFFEGNSKEVYDRMEDRVRKEQSPSAWS